MADCGLFTWDEDNFRLAHAPEDRQNAINCPAAGWSSYRTLFGANPPEPVQHAAPRTPSLFSPDPKTN